MTAVAITGAALDAATTARAGETQPGAYEILTLTEANFSRWDGFVDACPEATFFHRAGWKRVIERAFGHRTYFLLAQRNGQIEGILPLAHVKSFLFGNSLSSLPFCVYGGVAAIGEAARTALDAAAQRIAQELGVGYIEYRSQKALHNDWQRRDLYVTFRREIFADEEANLLAIPRKQRAMVRKGIKGGLTTELDDGVERFFAAYSTSVHRLGTPVFAKNYFRVLKQEFGDACEVQTILDKAKPIASVMSFYFRDEVLPYYGGGAAEARDLAGNDFMYWELMRRACAKGCKVFDFGRSKLGTGSFNFKKNWGFEPTPLAYEYQLVRAERLPDNNPLNPKYRLFIQAWQRLPLALANRIGPHIVKYLG